MQWCEDKLCEHYEELEDNHCSVSATIDRCHKVIKGMESTTDTFKEKLQYFLDNKCIGDWGNCPACTEYKEGSCHHPDHPSMQEVKMETPARVNSCVSKAFHDIRNTYNGLIYHFDSKMEYSVDPLKAIECMRKDLELMAMAERACKACKEAQNESR